jgi:hypothetical protein
MLKTRLFAALLMSGAALQAHAADADALAGDANWALFAVGLVAIGSLKRWQGQINAR